MNLNPIVSVVQYEGDNRTFVWKHPGTDFNMKSQLIVHESQKAIFFYEGKMADMFGPGRYTLETKNIPILTALGAAVISGGMTPFHAEVYFVNQTEQMGIPWGTASKVTFMEPSFGFPLQVGASGEMGLRVMPDHAQDLVVRLVGTEALASQEGLLRYFRAFMQTRIKTALANAIKENAWSIFEMDLHLEELSDAIKARLDPDFVEYGLELTQFLVTSIARPDGEREYERFKQLYFRQYADIRDAELRQQVAVIEQQTEAKQTVIEAQAVAQKRQLEGYTYQQERGFDVAQAVAANQAVGEFANLGVGMGVMGGVGLGLGGAVASSLNESMGAVAFGAMSGSQSNVSGDVAGAAVVAQGQGIGRAPGAMHGSNDELDNERKPDGAQQLVCPKCNAEVRSGWKLCPECGQSLQQFTCANCGTALESAWKLCPECGTPKR